MVEVVVALGLISVGLLGTLEMLSRVGQTRSASTRQVAATDLAASELAAMKSVAYTSSASRPVSTGCDPCSKGAPR